MEQIETKIPLSLPQQDIFIEQVLYPGKPIYNIGAKIEITGTIDFSLLERAYTRLIQDHDAYRIVIDGENTIPNACMINDRISPLEYIDYSDSLQPDEISLDFMSRNFKIPFKFDGKSALYRFVLIKVSENLYYLFSVYHHIITDGWGTSLMFQRLVKNYNEIVEYGEVRSAYPFRYIDFVNDDLRYQGSEDFKTDREYWISRFSNLKESFIPLQSKNKAISKSREFYIKRAKYNQLTDWSRSVKATSYHSILAILNVYFSRYYNLEDFTVGVPVLNRSNSNFKKTVGLFMGLAPLKISSAFGTTFEELVEQIKIQLRNDYRHQRFPVSKLIQGLMISHEKEKLFNITLSYEKQNYSDDFLNTRTKVIPLSHSSERVALAIYIREFDDSEDVKIDFEYNTSYFSDSYVTRLVGHFENILDQILLNPKLKTGQIYFLTEKERTNILKASMKREVHYPSNKTIVDLFCEQVVTTPEKVAVDDFSNNLTYSQLNSNSNKICNFIRSGSSSEEKKPIGVLIRRSIDLPTVLLGILKSGHPYIPLDPDFPESRINYILKHSKCEKIIIDDSLMENFDFKHVEKVLLSKVLESDLSGFTYDRPKPTDTAYIIYTSGSTGNPKGVEIGHQSLTNFLWSMKQEPGIGSDDLLYAVTTYSFDISILELFLPIIVGATVHIVTKELLQDPAKLISNIDTVKPTIIQATPGFFQMLISMNWKGGKSIRILCGGDRLNEVLAGKLISCSGQVWNMYGPTETTIWSSLKRITKASHSRSIGKPINNTCLLLLDQWLNAVPTGATGHIYIGGEGLAKGYYQDETLTNERFIMGEERIYFTGDLGRWNEEEEIEFLGRSDSQVKIRGYRIELGEIESKILQVYGIESAVVLAKQINGEPALVAYFKGAGEVSEFDILTYLDHQLPNYMVPGIIIPLEEFPKTPNQKVDRLALQAMEIAATDINHAQPVNHIEEYLLKLWKESLNVVQLGVHDNFFRLGGHSLSGVKMVYEINETFNCHLVLKDFFLYPTIRLLGERIQTGADKVKGWVIAKAPDKIYYDLSYPQMGIWIASQRKAASIAYNMNAVYQIEGDLNIRILKQSLLKVIKRHESLRTNFVEKEGGVKQVIRSKNGTAFEIGMHTADNDDSAESLIDSILLQEFRLDTDLLIRANIITLKSQNNILLFSCHHIIMDGWSLEILVKEVISIYNGFIDHAHDQIENLPIQFRDFSEWSNHREHTYTGKEYWMEVLRDYKIKNTFEPDKAEQNNLFTGNQINFSFERDEEDGLLDLCREQGITLFSLLTSLFSVFVFKFSGHDDFCLGTVTSGRNQRELIPLIGMFANTIPLRIKIDKTKRLNEIFDIISKNNIEAYEYDDFPWRELEDTLPMPFDVLVINQNPEFSLTDFDSFEGAQLKKFDYTSKTSRFLFTFNFYQDSAGLHCDVEYDTCHYTKETVNIMLLRFRNFMKSVLTDPALRVDEYDLALPGEKEIMNSVKITFNF